MISVDECWCQTNVDDSGNLNGELIHMNYEGNGVFVCPKCGEKSDYSKDTYRIKVKFQMVEGYMGAKIIDGEERINHHWDDDEKCYIIKDCLEETLNDMPYDYEGTWLNSHEDGSVFEIDFYFKNLVYETDCGTEYDIEAEVFSEKRIDA